MTRSSKNGTYGFGLKKDPNGSIHFVDNVQKDSVAYQSGLRKGDYILEVNNEPVNNLKSSEILKKFVKFPDRVELLVVADYEGFENKNDMTF